MSDTHRHRDVLDDDFCENCGVERGNQTVGTQFVCRKCAKAIKKINKKYNRILRVEEEEWKQ